MEALPAALIDRLPLPVTLLLRVPGHEGAVAVATSAARAEAARASGIVVFDPAEWNAIVTAAESDRLWPADLRAICARKAERPGWALEPDDALAGARPDGPRGWSVGRVLARIGAELVCIER